MKSILLIGVLAISLVALTGCEDKKMTLEELNARKDAGINGYNEAMKKERIEAKKQNNGR